LKKFNGREWKTLLILSVLIPIGLLSTFKLTGILSSPATIAETTTLNAAIWKIDPMMGIFNIWGQVKRNYEIGEISTVQCIDISDFNDKSGEYGGSDTLGMNITLAATVKSGFVNRVYISFREDYENSIVYLHNLELLKLSNLTEINYGDWLRGDVKAFLETSNPSRLSNVYLHTPVAWILRSANKGNQTRLLEIDYEITYFNGSIYKKIIQPFQISIQPDNNNDFEDAEEIGLGAHLEYVNSQNDPEDYYKTWLDQGQVCRVQLGYPWFNYWPQTYWYLGLETFIYDPDRNLIASLPYQGRSESTPITTEMTFTANTTGWWYIRVKYFVADHIYTLDVSILNGESG